MNRVKTKTILILLINFLVFGVAETARALDIGSYLQSLEKEAKSQDPSFKNFSESEGKAFFTKEYSRNGQSVSCATCHTQNPKAEGQTRAHKAIEPLAPAANPKRFTDSAKVEKWFLRNCKDVLDRECTVKEKGNFVLFLKNIK